MIINLHTIPNWDKPKSGMFWIIVDNWWLVDDDGNPLFYTKNNHPQCNKLKSIVEADDRGYKVKNLPIVYIPLNPRDYQG